MQILNLATLSLFVSSSLAAQCLGTPALGGAKVFIDGYWDARQKMCSNTECGYQQDCSVRTSKKYTAIGSATLQIEIKRKNTGGKKGFPDCWDATENIIVQCMRDNNLFEGVWSYNGQLYQINAWY